MCGLLFFHGPNAQGRLSTGLTLLKHRGPDDGHSWANDLNAIGFRRLSINDQSQLGRQPYQHKNYIGAINGEIYNYKTLIDRFGLSIEGQCDTRIILPLFDILGEDLIHKLDGFYSGLIFDQDTNRVVCIRDYMGKKPLFYGRSGEEFFITSELKAINEIDWFKIVPLGMTELDCISGNARVVSSHKTRLPSNKSDVLTLMEASVRKRMVQPDQPIGLFLSGGLDSSIIAYFASKFRDDIFYYTLADENSPDLKFVRMLEKKLQLKSVSVLSLPTQEDLGDYIRRVIYASESYNPSVISNGLATFLLAEAAKKDGVKVVLTGEGADELFCGYHHFRREQDWGGIRNQLIHDLHFTELRRLDSCSMANGIEARCPFLDRSLKYFSDTLSYDDFIKMDIEGAMINKAILRDAFREKLPIEIINRAKTSFDVGSGIRGLVVSYLKKTGTTERETAKKIWRDLFGYDDTQNYFHSYPVFDSAIDQRGISHRGQNEK